MSESGGYSKGQMLGWGVVIVALLFFTRGQWGPIVFPTATPTPSPTPEPIPTSTPIPGYVAREEALAYASFATFYDQDCAKVALFPDEEYGEEFLDISIDLSQPGWGVYIGDGLWRFHIIEKHKWFVLSTDNVVQVTSISYEEETVTATSLADGTWNANEVCPYAGFADFTIPIDDFEPSEYDPSDNADLYP